MVQKQTITISHLINSLPGGAEGFIAQDILKAYQFAQKAHGDHHRPSGESYLEHDIAIAHTISHVISDREAIIAGLLHDTILPHTNCTTKEIAKEFNPKIAALVAGTAKLNYDELYQNNQLNPADAMRRAVFIIVEEDVRVLLIAMADCLQDLRKAKPLPPEERHKIASCGMHIYATLANRLGIWKLKWELEDLSFRYLEPDKYVEIAKHLDQRRAERHEHVGQALDTLREELRRANIKGEVTGRPKHIVSIYRKMQRKKVSVSDIYDLQAIRVILDSDDKHLCYQVLGIVHDLWQPISQEFDDYIARPKPNGYQSLHTAVFDEKNRTLEVQIRTRAMHERAEKGVAAHWAYKEGGRQSSAEHRQIESLRQLLSAYQDENGANSAVDAELLANEVVADRIYVFTPKNELRDLPVGATPIDFAYAIHTEVGHRCRGAKVNGKMVSLDYKLKNGDRVSIITSSRGGPSRDWMNENLGYAVSARTRNRIRQWFRTQERAKNIEQGREVVHRELKRLGLQDDYDIDDIALALNFEERDEFLARVGFGDVQSRQIAGAIAAMQQKLKPDDELRPLLQSQPKARGLTVMGVSGLHTRMGMCCNPVPPESIIGYVTRGHGVTIHRQDCKQVLSIDEKERLIDVEWGIEEDAYAIPIVIKAYRRAGLMEEIANLLKGQRVNLSKAKTTTSNSINTIYMVIEVTSLDQLNWLLQKFENLNNVIEAHRQRWHE
ncbi:MAG TPA: bifunctional (p)ppGpp synthetase/guanosine-3',5'-bis(diphosphate) 3'-pyrophosphohydrolase [Anaerolineae bacterium]|nr:bifunctional (p)ppGpp synthetase/guanosine-3',5'-bis(diphosphate) 3'-pyrophosphohydrolase [Anaerolineae bacterium]